MGNSPSRNDLNSCNNSSSSTHNDSTNNNASPGATSALSDDPDPLPIHLTKSHPNLNNSISNIPLKNSAFSSTPASSHALLGLTNSSDDDSGDSTSANSCFTPVSLSSISSASNNHIGSNTLKNFPKNLYSIKEITNSSSFSSSSASPTPSTSPSSTNSNDLPFQMELNKSPLINASLSSTPPKVSLNPKIKHPPPSNSSATTTTTTTTTTKSSESSKPSTTSIDLDSIIERLVAAGLSKQNPKTFNLTNDEIKFICAKSRRIFMSQPMLLELAAPVKIVGDIHGQFQDLLRIFRLCGFPPNSNYLFLGDYVDRGKQSLETMVLLLCLKIRYPENFFLLRGNHESADITKMYGFYDECKRRTSNGVRTWKLFVDVFNTLPVAATIADKIFCVHGGLSPELKDLSQIKKIQRPTDIPDEGLLADLLWSDPQDNSDKSSSRKDKDLKSKSKSKSKAKFSNDWKQNDRGVSYCFSENVVKNFCANLDFDLIARGHMVVEEGYEFYGRRRLVTIFSAPNYCGEFRNWGAVMNVNKKLMCSFELLKPKKGKK